MLALEPLIQARLRALSALTGWAVRGGSVDADRRSVPAVDVRLEGAVATQVRMPAVTLQPAWSVALVVSRSDTAAAQMDAAIRAVIGSLHGWVPAAGWTELQVARVQPSLLQDAGLCGFEVVFQTAAVFEGQQ